MNDLISRQAAINAPVRMVSEGIEWIPVYHVEQLPSAQPQRIKGRWELLPGRDDEHIRYLHCSVCHFNGDYESNFCPNCGVDMRGYTDEV